MDISKHLEKAAEFVKRKNFDQALALYKELLTIQPQDYQIRQGLLEAARLRATYKKPQKAFVMASTGHNLARAKTLQAFKQWGKAAQAWQKAVLVDPANLAWASSLGECLQIAQMPGAALAVYEHIAQINPQELEAWKQCGKLAYQLGDFAKSKQFYEQALNLNPRDHESIKARKQLAAQGMLQDKGFANASSSRELIKAQEKPVEVEIKETLGAETELRLKNIEQEIQRLKAEDAATNKAKIQELETQHQLLELENLTHQLESRPMDMAVRFHYGKALFAISRIEEAIAQFQKAAQDPRWKLDCALELGKCFYRKGFMDMAKQQLEKALKFLPSDSARCKEILYNLGLIAERANSREEAAGYYSQIYAMDIGYKDVAQKVEQLRS